MDKQALFDQIKGGLIVSCQALEHEPLYTKEGGIMPLMAKAAAQSGAVGIRANTVRDITQIKEAVDLPVIGIIKKDYEGTPMYITVTMKEVDELVACGVDILAVQGTSALRPDGSTAAQQTVQPSRKESHVPMPEPILSARPCVDIHRRHRAVMTSILISSMNFPKNARQRSSQRDISTIRSRQRRHWRQELLHW